MPRKQPDYDRETAARVVGLRRGGVPFDTIAEQLHLTPNAAKALFDKHLGSHDPEFQRALEGDRLDRMHAAIWPKAIEGELDAIDRVVKISERREHVAVVPKENTHDLRNAFDLAAETATELRADAVDAALVEAGRKIADRVDEATATGEGQEITKALYLLPHMLNVLREMQATPASRTAAETAKRIAEAAQPPPSEAEGKLAQLRAIRTKRPG
jgi:hypothetical protein